MASLPLSTVGEGEKTTGHGTRDRSLLPLPPHRLGGRLDSRHARQRRLETLSRRLPQDLTLSMVRAGWPRPPRPPTITARESAPTPGSAWRPAGAACPSASPP